MDLRDAVHALILGIVEGGTEFIPVSSTGHLLLAGHFLGFESTGRVFEVAIQLGAVLAIIVLYAGRLWAVVRAAPHDPQARLFFGAVAVAFLPAAIAGLALHDVIKTVLFESPRLIATMLILGGVVLLFVDRMAVAPRHDDAMRLPLRVALVVGLFQCLALVPGVSRSGATIVGGLLLGASKRAAAEFSFFLSLPTMGAAVAFDLWQNRDVLDSAAFSTIAVGFAAAFISGMVVVRWLLRHVAHRGYAIFGWWRIIVGSAALGALTLGF